MLHLGMNFLISLLYLEDQIKIMGRGSGCVAQLVEWLLPISEFRGLNPVIGKNLFMLNIFLLSTVY